MPLKPARPLVDGPDSVWVGSIEHLATVGLHIDQAEYHEPSDQNFPV